MDQPSRAEIDWDGIAARLAPIRTERDPGLRRLKSRDFHWFSPILKSRLDGCLADLVVAPRDRAELRQVVAFAARERLPITMRGGGTGNYGQAVPLAGGLVIDTDALDRIHLLAPGRVRADCGTRIHAINAAARRIGFEMRLYPSTARTSSLAGFVAGGAGGIGSCPYGILTQPGNVLGATLLTVEETPREIALDGRGLAMIRHAYGTTGILLDVEMPLGPAYAWVENGFAFVDFAAAAGFARAIVAANDIMKRETATLAWPAPAHLAKVAPVIAEGRHHVFASVADISIDALDLLAGEHGADRVFRYVAAEGEDRGHPPVYEFGWNHATLSALRADRSLPITYLQCGAPPGREIETIEAVRAHFGEEVTPQMEWVRLGPTVTAFGLHLVRYTTPQRLAEIARIHAETFGMFLKDPHRPDVEHGKPLQLHREMARFKQAVDPHGLLNPGKLTSTA